MSPNAYQKVSSSALAKIQGVKHDLIRWILGGIAATIITIIGTGMTIIHYLAPLAR
jgi:hypothetical protein